MTDDETSGSNGKALADGDSVTLIKDLKVRGSGGVTVKRGQLVKNIRLTGDTDEIEANVRSNGNPIEPASRNHWVPAFAGMSG
ncbi:PhnA domain-containing protein [Brevundimonas sp.]|uniref:PhnA domain-containing protein n=1 Tax=Brevundimonas sp. TaxID=1871086 RepID=UPI0035698E19